jgi:hypothetical protein
VVGHVTRIGRICTDFFIRDTRPTTGGSATPVRLLADPQHLSDYWRIRNLSDYWRIRITCPTTGGSAFFISAFYFFTKNRFT